jgi:hypothetical protein
MNNLEKVVDISGICTNCKNEKSCDFVKDIKALITNKKCAKKIRDTELIIYSCEGYDVEKDIYPESGVCLKQENK